MLVKNNPLIHCITNYVVPGDNANLVLSYGGKPIMASSPKEVEEITSKCDALSVNLGTISEDKAEAIKKSCKVANKLNKPIILDPVAIGFSNYRKELVKYLIANFHFNVIKGNISEIKTIFDFKNTSYGVDSKSEDEKLSIKNKINIGKIVAEKTQAIIVITGKEDIIIGRKKIIIIKNGTELMSRITGTGCGLGVIIATNLGKYSNNLYGVVKGVLDYNISAQLSKKKFLFNNSSMVFKDNLISKVGDISAKHRKKYGDYKIYNYGEENEIK